MIVLPPLLFLSSLSQSEDAVKVSFKHARSVHDPLGAMSDTRAYSTVAQSSDSVDESASLNATNAEDHSQPESAVLL